MFPIVELPEIVKHYSGWLAPVFSDEALVQCQRYLSGLIISENKTIEGINRLVVHESRHQSSLNRLLTAAPFSEKRLNEQRLALLASLPGTQMKKRGVLSVDDTLLTHYGEHFEQIANLWDPVEKRYTWAHKLVTLHYSDEQTDYPVVFQLWQPADLEKLEKGLPAAGVVLLRVPTSAPIVRRSVSTDSSSPRRALVSMMPNRNSTMMAPMYTRIWVAPTKLGSLARPIQDIMRDVRKVPNA